MINSEMVFDELADGDGQQQSSLELERNQPREVYVARQPIFDRRRQAVAYELLYRSGQSDKYDAASGNTATAQVIVNTFMAIGINHVTGGRRAFINFTKDLLLSHYVSVLPKDLVVIEVLETIEPANEVIDACRELKSLGYKLALDDFVLVTDEYRPLLNIADIIKVDFQGATPRVLASLPAALRSHGVKLLAEKVETDEEYIQAIRWGYEYFQGYFFSRPVIVKGQDVPGFKANYLRVMQEVNRDELDFQKLEEVVRSELSLTVKLLRYVNSAAFVWRSRIESIGQALVALGEREFRKWVSLVCLTSMGEDKPRELLVQSAVRAYYCEAIAKAIGDGQRASDYFLTGLLSHLEAIIGRPLPMLIDAIPLHQDVRDALLEGHGPLADTLHSLLAFEVTDWEALAAITHRLGIPLRTVSDAYHSALNTADVLFRVASL